MKKPNNNTNIFRLLRIARDKTIKEVADALLVTPAYVSAIEKGNRNPSKRLIRDYAKIFNIDEKIIELFSEQVAENTKFEQALLMLLKMICEM